MIDTPRIQRTARGAYRRLVGLMRDDGARRAPAIGRAASVLSVASGKGGTGKSVLAANLACMRAQRGERVVLVDLDAGLANAHLLLGLAPAHDLGHVLTGDVSVSDALVEGPAGVRVLSGGVGRDLLTNPTRRDLDRLFRALRPLEDRFDLIVLDHGAGLGYATLAGLAAARTLFLVTGHEVTALSDGYALYKRARQLNPGLTVGVVMNRVPTHEAALAAWKRLDGVSRRFLGHGAQWAGWVPADPAVATSVERRLPVVLGDPESPAARAIASLARWGPIDARSATSFFDRARDALR